MANTALFAGATRRSPAADTRNEAGGRAYSLSAKQRLTQLAITGCFNNTFYSDAEQQLANVKSAVEEVGDDTFLAKLCLYSRQRAFLKDMPAALVVQLVARDSRLMQQVFDRVIDTGRMLRTCFQMIRSGKLGRRSLSSSLQRAFQRWLNQASVEQLVSASIGKNPSLRDILRMARPTPNDNERRALFGWLTDQPESKWMPATSADLPELIRRLQAFRQAETEAAQIEALQSVRVRWDMLADAVKGPRVWRALARQMGPQALRMNLNTLVRQQAFAVGGQSSEADQTDEANQVREAEQAAAAEFVTFVSEKLADENDIRRSRQFPYQFFSAFLNAGENVPQSIKDALQRAAEIACGNVPQLSGPVVIGVDVSGSMSSPITGYRGGGTSSMRCIDVAALFGAAIVRRNPGSVLIPFDTSAYQVETSPSEPILELAKRLAQFGGGGTECSLPLEAANRVFNNSPFAGCILISDMESWVGSGRDGQTAVLTQWDAFVTNQRRLQGVAFQPKLVCINLQPYGTVQASERTDIFNVGGFNDAVFEVVSNFLDNDTTRLVNAVEAIAV